MAGTQPMYSRAHTRGRPNPNIDPFNNLTRGHAIQVNFIDGATIEDYVVAVAEEVGHENVIAASKCDRMAKVFVKENDMVDFLCANGLQVNGHYLDVHPLQRPYSKLTLSGVPPFIPNEVLLHHLQPFGKAVSAMRYIPLGCKTERLSHVKSFRRHVNFKFDPETPLGPSLNIPYYEDIFRIYISTDDNKIRCEKCRKFGHATVNCRAILPDAVVPQPSTSGEPAPRQQKPSTHPRKEADAGGAPTLEPTVTLQKPTTLNVAQDDEPGTVPAAKLPGSHHNSQDDGPGNAPVLEPAGAHQNSTTSSVTQDVELEDAPAKGLGGARHNATKTHSVVEVSGPNPKKLRSELSELVAAATVELPQAQTQEMTVSDNEDDDNMSVASQSSLTSEVDFSTPCQILSTAKVLEYIEYTKGSPNPLKKAKEFTDDVDQLYWSLRRYRSATKLTLWDKRKIQRLIHCLKPGASKTK